ncbi:hypothetical protein CPC08DRAFT_704944 [Agrocybe pediades]|nr:hypothetical protein CPC08DRAFT_704944 [Agrocybe pediades]
MAKLTSIFSAVLLFVAAAAALPAEAEAAAPAVATDVVYHCGNGVDVCPSPAYTCCGPLLEGVGGTCRILKPGQACIF